MKKIIIITCLLLGVNSVHAYSFESLWGKSSKSEEMYTFLIDNFGFKDKADVEQYWQRKRNDATPWEYFNSVDEKSGKYNFPLEIFADKGIIKEVKFWGRNHCTEACYQDPKWAAFYQQELEGGIRLNMEYKAVKKKFNPPINKYKSDFIHSINEKYEVMIIVHKKSTVRLLIYRQPK